MSLDNRHALAQAVHDLGAAAWFGGSVMGVAGVNKSGAALTEPIDKVRAAGSAWQRFAPVQWAGVAAVLAMGTRLTATSGGRVAAQPGFARAGAVKAGVSVAGAAATAFAAYSGKKVSQLAEQAQHSGGFDVTDASQPSAQTPPELAAWQKRQRAVQYLVPALSGANIVLNSYLVQSYRPTAAAKGVLGRLLPG
jgi:uncharacterized membrane protein